MQNLHQFDSNLPQGPNFCFLSDCILMNLIIDKNLPDSVSTEEKWMQTYLHPTAPIAAVKLQHVHAPVGEGLSVCLYVEL